MTDTKNRHRWPGNQNYPEKESCAGGTFIELDESPFSGPFTGNDLSQA